MSSWEKEVAERVGLLAAGTAARPPLRSGPPQLRCDVQKSLRDFCRTQWVRPHTLLRKNKKPPKDGGFYFYVAERVSTDLA